MVTLESLGAVLVNDFLKILDFIQKRNIDAGELQKLNADGVFVAANGDSIKKRFAKGHSGMCCIW
jgi:hypothetical protein